jgi:hypothetical protein
MKNKDSAPNQKEMEQVINAMLKAWEASSIYIAPNADIYFKYALPIMDINGARRISSGTKHMIIEGRQVMTDEYELKNGKRIRIGYNQ